MASTPFKRYFRWHLFLLLGNIIEYIGFWRFKSINMTWNIWLVFTKSAIMGLNNISQWPCPLGVYCVYYMTLFNTFALHACLWSSGMTLASHGVHSWFETHTRLWSIAYFFWLLKMFCTFCSFFPAMANHLFSQNPATDTENSAQSRSEHIFMELTLFVYNINSQYFCIKSGLNYLRYKRYNRNETEGHIFFCNLNFHRNGIYIL